jgi:hypothetical protein
VPTGAQSFTARSKVTNMAKKKKKAKKAKT